MEKSEPNRSRAVRKDEGRTRKAPKFDRDANAIETDQARVCELDGPKLYARCNESTIGKL